MGGKVFILPEDKAINKNSSARYLPECYNTKLQGK